MIKLNTSGHARRTNASRRLVGLSLAAALSVTTTSVFAQGTFEFEDPMDQIRAKIERIETGGTAPPKIDVATPTATRSDALATPDVKDPLARMSDRLGLPPLGLVALAGLALLALLLGLMWLFGGFKNRRANYVNRPREDDELYAVADGARGRRELESGSAVTRNRKNSLDTREIVAPGAAAAAKIGDANGTQDENYGRDGDLNFDQAVDQPSSTSHPAASAEDGTESWARPNLDRLKSSIRKDWHAGDETEKADVAEAGNNYQPDPEPASEQSSFRDESEIFASLFGHESDETAAQPTSASPSMNKLGKSGAEETFSQSQLRDVVKANADVRPSATTPLPKAANQVTREDAIRRIRALRDSVKAS